MVSLLRDGFCGHFSAKTPRTQRLAEKKANAISFRGWLRRDSVKISVFEVEFPRPCEYSKKLTFTRENLAMMCTESSQKGPMSQPETRASLILQLTGQASEPAWVEFVSSYEPFLMKLVLRRGVPNRHAPDVTQQIFLAIARSVRGWQDDGKPESFRRWLNRVAQNVVIRFMTRERRQPGGTGGSDLVEFLETVPADPDQQHVADYERELILWAADQVRGEFRETSWLAFHETVIQACEVADVAIELGVSAGSIYMSRSRIMARIRGIIDQVK